MARYWYGWFATIVLVLMYAMCMWTAVVGWLWVNPAIGILLGVTWTTMFAGLLRDP